MRWTGLLTLCLVAASSAGCANRPRHGFLLRGSWSLECNRVPWIVSRVHEDSDQSAACYEDAASCGVPGTACGVRDVSCATCDGEGCDACRTRIRCGGCGFRWLLGPKQCESGEAECPRCRRLVRRPLLGGLKRRAPLEPTHHETPYSRFHPVPTHPVFSNAEPPGDAQPSLAPAQPSSAAAPTPRPPTPGIETFEPEAVPPGPSVESPKPKARLDSPGAKAKPKATWQPERATPPPPAAPSSPASPAAKSPNATETSADRLFHNLAPPDAPVPGAAGVWQPTSLVQAN